MVTGNKRSAEHRVVAFMDSGQPMGGNIIHSDDGAREYGFRGALVIGGYVYGWTVPAILEVLGERWLSDGWTSINLRRPTYTGDELTATVTLRDDGVADLAMANQDGEVCLSGEVGLGKAPWLGELTLPQRLTPEPRPAERPRLTLENAPVGQDLRPMSVTITREAAIEFALQRQGDDNPLWSGERPLVHPGWIIGRMSPLNLHSYTYSPSILAGTQIQHLAPFEAGQTLTVAGHFRDAFERNGHHYCIIDGLILSQDGRPLVQVRQRSIFNVAKR